MTLIIAEAGVNHNGDEKLALKLIKAAFDAGANIVKFQTFKAKNLVTSQAVQAEYQAENTGIKESQLEMLSRLELSYDTHRKLINYCDELGIEFLSTAFDSESLKFLVNELGLSRLKIPSGEITNAPLLLEHARTNCDLIVSTGMSTMDEIKNALGVIAFGYTSTIDAIPSIASFEAAYTSEQGQKALKDKVSILHCTSEYPAPFEDINLKAMDSIHEAFGLPVGYSDHSKGIEVSIAAVARGAHLIEKHFTLNKNMSGPDHKASLDPKELQIMINGIRKIELSLGDGIKKPASSEIKNKTVARKSLVAAREIIKGSKLTIEDIAIKRPGTGLSPYKFWQIVGKVSTNSYKPGDLINE